MLRDQWIKEIHTLFGMTAGIIGSGQWDIEPTLVVGNIQTVSKHIMTLSKEFGTVIMDEAHHCPATTFTEVIDGMYSKYRIALSGTMIRKDGKHILFKDYFGSKVVRPEKSNTIDPEIKILKPGLHLKQGVQWAQKINDLLYDNDYQEFIAGVAQTQINKGHKVLIVAERVEFLTRLKELIGDSCALVTGDTSFEERERIKEDLELGKYSCIAGSRQIFSEGISINILSCLILPSPIANESLLEQLIGRIMRIHENKPNPIVVDIQFSGSSDRKQNSLRLGFYASKGWKITSI